MIGAVSHELRTPLSSIVGAVSVLAASPGDCRQREAFAACEGPA